LFISMRMAASCGQALDTDGRMARAASEAIRTVGREALRQ
jgi:hypothetical protein